MCINKLKFKKTISISIGLLIAFFSQKWFEQAFEQPTEFEKWFILVLSLIILSIIIYFNLDEKGHF